MIEIVARTVLMSLAIKLILSLTYHYCKIYFVHGPRNLQGKLATWSVNVSLSYLEGHCQYHLHSRKALIRPCGMWLRATQRCFIKTHKTQVAYSHACWNMLTKHSVCLWYKPLSSSFLWIIRFYIILRAKHVCTLLQNQFALHYWLNSLKEAQLAK